LDGVYEGFPLSSSYQTTRSDYRLNSARPQAGIEFGKTVRLRFKQYKCWETPKSWFEDMVARLSGRFGSVYVIQPISMREIPLIVFWLAFPQ
jgi:hypothetical protein